jgi:hypothetical protein
MEKKREKGIEGDERETTRALRIKTETVSDG